MPLPAEENDVLSQSDAQRARELANEYASRRMEALRLYEPTEIQNRFHSCTAKQCIFQAGNQVGKSLAAFVELSRAVTGQDPHDKYPKENGIGIVVGWDESHIGVVIHKYLFRRGAFKLIRDKVTGDWRAWKPWLPEDKARIKETKDAPPLIPKRYIKDIAWESKRENIFSEVKFTNGWILYARSSRGEPMAGIQADIVLFDEDLQRPEWFNEMMGRLLMRNGKLRWSALPLSKNDALVNLVERANEEAANENPEAVAIRATVFDNPFMTEEARNDAIKSWKAMGEDVYRQRALGELVTDSHLMYPKFSIHQHDAIKTGPLATPVQKIITENNGVPPADWCRYLAIDPGHSTCAVTFFAVPPPTVGDQVVCYDELYLRQCDAQMLAKKVHEKIQFTPIQEFIIDMHGARLTSIGSGISPYVQYKNAFRELGLASIATGSDFRAGSDDIAGRESLLRAYLEPDNDGNPRLLFVIKNVPNTVREFQRFKKKITQGIVQEDGERRRGKTHAVETVEYAIARGMRWHKPPVGAGSESVYQRFLANKKRFSNRLRGPGGLSSGVISLGPIGCD